MPGSPAFGLLLVAWDGTNLDLADSVANTEAFIAVCTEDGSVRTGVYRLATTVPDPRLRLRSSWPPPTRKGGSARPESERSRPACAAPDGPCGAPILMLPAGSCGPT